MTTAGVAQSVTERNNQAVALGPLQQVADSLRRAREGQLPTGALRMQLLHLVPGLGCALLPQLLRSLASESETEAQWSMQLLRRADLTQVTTRLGKLLAASGPSDEVKARALSVLADLGVSPPTAVAIQDPDGFIQRSVSQLLSTIESADDLRRTADDLLSSVPGEELLSVMREVVRHGGEQGAALLEVVMVDPRTPHEVAVELVPLSRPTRAGSLLGQAASDPFLPQPRPTSRNHKPRAHRFSSSRSLIDALPVHRRVAQVKQPQRRIQLIDLQPAMEALAQQRKAARCSRRASDLQSTQPNA